MIIHVLSDEEIEAIKSGNVVSVMTSGTCVGLTGKQFVEKRFVKSLDNKTG